MMTSLLWNVPDLFRLVTLESEGRLRRGFSLAASFACFATVDRIVCLKVKYHGWFKAPYPGPTVTTE
jgi:hypothetical protein